MSIGTKTLLCLLLAAVCAGAPVEPGGPRFRLKNGTILEDPTEIEHLNGTPLELFCTGQADDLEVTDDFGYRLPTTDTNTENITYIKVVVDSLPMVVDFECKSENLESLNCDWISDNIRINSSLYYMEDGASFFLCNQVGIWQNYYDCTWDEKHTVVNYHDKSAYDTLTFLMNSCNQWGCANQTFVIDHYAVLKLNTPIIFNMIENSLSVVLELFVGLPFQNTINWEYKIIYWQSGIYHFQVNGTYRSCIKIRELGCKVEFNLPCADTHYKIWVSVKASTAVGEEFWSKLAAMDVVTAPDPDDSGTAVANPTCEHLNVNITPDAMLYEMSKFRNEVIKEQKTLKRNIQSLKSKADQINQP